MKDKGYNLEDLLHETTSDLENIGTQLAEETREDLSNALEEAGRELKKSLEKFEKSMKREIKSGVLNFYHDHKKVVNQDLKGVNAFVKELLSEVKDGLDDGIWESDDKDVRKELRALRKEVVHFSRKYNHKYAMLRLKLAFGNAGVSIKNAFSS